MPLHDLTDPFTVADVQDSMDVEKSLSREARMQRVRRTLNLLDGDYIKREKHGGQWEIIRLPEFADL